jgi:antitoxin (DNA-binding transcriptional repressor) of toxin-antitoxin stability system
LKTIELRDATESLGECASALAGEPLVVIDGGAPVAVLIPVQGTDLESLSLSTDPDFLDMLERSRREQREARGISSEEMRRRLGIPR